MRPLCADRAAGAAFEAWRGRLVALGVELTEPDLFVVGLVASRQANLEGLRVLLAREKDLGKRLRILAAEEKAAVGLRGALELMERTFGARVVHDAEASAPAHATAGGKVLPMPGNLGRRAPRGRGPDIVQQRILAALAKAGVPLTRDALRRRVQADDTIFLRTLAASVESGAVKRSGAGVKSRPHVYSVPSRATA